MWYSWCPSPTVAVVPLLCNQAPMPSKQGVRSNDRCNLVERVSAKGLGLDREDPPLVVGQQEALPAHPLHQHPDLGVLEFDDLRLPAMDPTGNIQKEKVPGAEDKSHGDHAIQD